MAGERASSHTLGDSSADKYSHGFKYISCQTHSLAQTRAHTHTQGDSLACVCVFFFSLTQFLQFLKRLSSSLFSFFRARATVSTTGLLALGQEWEKITFFFRFVFGQCLTTEEEGGVSQFSRVNAVFLFRVGGPLSGRFFILCSAAGKVLNKARSYLVKQSWRAELKSIPLLLAIKGEAILPHWCVLF